MQVSGLSRLVEKFSFFGLFVMDERQNKKTGHSKAGAIMLALHYAVIMKKVVEKSSFNFQSNFKQFF